MPRFVLAIFLLTLAGCAKSEPVAEKIQKSTAEEPLKKYALHGEVSRLDAENKIATIKHQAIGDWMGAMTMDFPVKDPADFAKLAAGKPVEATVFVQGLNYWVAEVK
jgi:Cu/Ag efflux protein CusF